MLKENRIFQKKKNPIIYSDIGKGESDVKRFTGKSKQITLEKVNDVICFDWIKINLMVLKSYDMKNKI